MISIKVAAKVLGIDDARDDLLSERRGRGKEPH